MGRSATFTVSKSQSLVDIPSWATVLLTDTVAPGTDTVAPGCADRSWSALDAEEETFMLKVAPFLSHRLPLTGW